MRVYQLPKGGAGIEALVHVDRPDSKPAHRQVLVKVKACSLNFRDLAIARGSYRMPVRDNLIPLSDGAGEVIETGPGVTRVKVGDHVAGNFFQRWSGGAPAADAHKSALGGGIDGMLAEYAVLEEDGAVKIPAHLSLEEGATLPCAAVTVWHAMVEHAKLQAGGTVLLQGTGGVSIFGFQFENRNAAGPLQQHRTAGLELGVLDHRMPDRNRRAGKRRAFLQRQVRRDFYGAVFLEHGVFGEHAVNSAAERAFVRVGRWRATAPALKEISGNVVANFHSRHPGTSLDHFTGAVRQRDEVVAYRHAIATAGNSEIAEIERGCFHLYQDLPIGGLGIGPIALSEGFDPGAAFRQLIGAHVFLPRVAAASVSAR